MTVKQPRQKIKPNPIFRHRDMRKSQMATSGRTSRMKSVAILNPVLARYSDLRSIECVRFTLRSQLDSIGQNWQMSAINDPMAYPV